MQRPPRGRRHVNDERYDDDDIPTPLPLPTSPCIALPLLLPLRTPPLPRCSLLSLIRIHLNRAAYRPVGDQQDAEPAVERAALLRGRVPAASVHLPASVG